MALGQLKHLPDEMGANPFHPLLARFSRLKAGSFETLFQVESYLLRFSWLGLFAMIALALLASHFEFEWLPTVARLATLVYPCFFIWSLTRLAGVELLQLVLEGQWTADLLASPLGDRQFTVGFASPIWLTVRQYFLITLFSLIIYGLETQVIVHDPLLGYLLDDLIGNTLFNLGLFYCGAAWIVFLYVARLYVEIRLRNGLLKGLATLALLLGGLLLLAMFIVLFGVYPNKLTDGRVLAGLAAITLGLSAAAIWIYRRLAGRFRLLLTGQLDIDLLIDDADPHASAWEPLGAPSAR